MCKVANNVPCGDVSTLLRVNGRCYYCKLRCQKCARLGLEEIYRKSFVSHVSLIRAIMYVIWEIENMEDVF